MERKIGEVFTCNGKLYQVVKGFSCNGCAFIKNGNCYTANKLLGPCTYMERTDKTSVIFKEIKGMEIKNNQLTIDIPKGHIIDVEHSDLSKGIIKFKDANITLEDIPCIIRDDIKINAFISKSSTCYNYLNKLKAIATLIDIANYYNKGWKPNWSTNKEYKYCIQYNKKYDEYSIYYSFLEIESIIYFKNKEDVQSIIGNPNFRYILDTIYKN